MEVNVLTDKQQEFNGTVYYLCGSYYQHKGQRLHRTVWKYHNGDIPKGFHVHHIDGNRHNNSIDNLELLSAHEHEVLHGSDDERKKKCQKNIKKAIDAATEWHHTDQGREWHSQHAIETWAKMPLKTYVCDFCGKEFKSKFNYSPKSNRFCHPNCKASYRRRRLKNESKEY